MFLIIVILNYLHRALKDLEEYKNHFHGRIILSKENEPLPHINICQNTKHKDFLWFWINLTYFLQK